MGHNALLELFARIMFSFTKSVTDQYNPEEPEYTTESFGYNPLESTGREWYYHPVDELIYQEYSDRDLATNSSYLAASSLNVEVIDACSTERENEETGRSEKEVDSSETAWRRFRPSVWSTIWKSLYVGALISLLCATIVGTVFMTVSYLCYQTLNVCEFVPQRKLIPLRVQWTRTASAATAIVFLYGGYYSNVMLLFRYYQLQGVKKKLFLACCIPYCLDVAYRIILQALGMSFSKLSAVQKFPANILFLTGFSVQVYFLIKHFCARPVTRQISLFLQMTAPGCLTFLIALVFGHFIYPTYIKEDKEGKLLIAIFAPLIGAFVKPISRICAQRLWNITHPGYSYVLLAFLYYGTAVVFRILQADLDSLQSIAILGIIHGAAEVIERSTMVVIDHICLVLWKRSSSPWGSFPTPRRERLMADIAIMSMLAESVAIVSVNGVRYLYQWVYFENSSLPNLLQSFAIFTSVPLLIEWFFSSLSVAIETRYQNMAVMAVWRRKWKRHFLVALVNTVSVALFLSNSLIAVVHERFNQTDFKIKPCKMPFT